MCNGNSRLLAQRQGSTQLHSMLPVAFPVIKTNSYIYNTRGLLLSIAWKVEWKSLKMQTSATQRSTCPWSILECTRGE